MRYAPPRWLSQQYFIVHEGPRGASVLAKLEHHVLGLGGVYRDFSVEEARVQTLGPSRVLRITTLVVETEVSSPSKGAPASKRESSREEKVTLCALSTPSPRAPFCLHGLPLRESGADDTGPWERVYDLRLGSDGTVTHTLVRGPAADKATQHKLW